ncbi:hypothetical protein E3N88_20712 [Mikania micrantha]|uniref:Uncharacterized protein n=1 Tax=Mikania micrantha TaxID=192012 RepID=A0A5N6NKL0_9ASTR|nr:hypothetical protein E3N88_20711 [Mikania micrantha]KAD4888639.1 hypothetical protein E3N88_20712 [Mikania micrantha]
MEGSVMELHAQGPAGEERLGYVQMLEGSAVGFAGERLVAPRVRPCHCKARGAARFAGSRFTEGGFVYMGSAPVD